MAEGVLRHPDVMVIAEADMEVEGSFDPHSVLAAIEVVSRSNPDNDWTSKMRDHPLLGVPIYVIFDPRTGEGAVFSDIHTTPRVPATPPARTSSTGRRSRSANGPSPRTDSPATRPGRTGELETLTGHPVRHRYTLPGESSGLPPADAMLVAPLTTTSACKWSAGITDTVAPQ